MNKNWGLIIFLALMVWQVVSVILQSSAKKQQQERQRELARQRSRSGGSKTTVSTSSPRDSVPRRPGDSEASRGIASRIESLEQRRRAQLEELRARRQQRAAARSTTSSRPTLQPPSQPTPTRPTTVRLPSTKPPAGRPPKTIATLEAGLGRWQQAQDADRRRGEVERRKVLEQQRLQSQRDAAATEAEKRRRAQRKAAARAEREREELAARQALTTISLGGPLNVQLRDRSALARAFVLKELLDPPVSMREV